MTAVAFPLSGASMTMSGSLRRLCRAWHCCTDSLGLGGLACLRAALTPSLSQSAEMWSSLQAVASGQ